MHIQRTVGLALRAQHTDMVQIAFILPVQTLKTKPKWRNALQEALMLVEMNFPSRNGWPEKQATWLFFFYFFLTIWKAQNDQFGVLRQWRKNTLTLIYVSFAVVMVHTFPQGTKKNKTNSFQVVIVLLVEYFFLFFFLVESVLSHTLPSKVSYASGCFFFVTYFPEVARRTNGDYHLHSMHLNVSTASFSNVSLRLVWKRQHFLPISLSRRFK